MLKDLCLAGVECMANMPGPEQGRRDSYKNVIASILSLIVAIIIIGFVGKYLWNMTMPELFTFARPVQSATQIIGFMILVALFR